MRTLRSLLALCALLAALAPAHAAPGVAPTALTSQQRLPNGQTLLVLCYHEVVPQRGADADALTVDTATLAAHLNWLRSEGYRPIRLDALLAAYDGAARLPERAVLLTFDDGYLGLYTQVFPLLRAFQAPALAALVGRWIEAQPAAAGPRTEHEESTRDRFISWEQAREMQASGLIEFASHTWDLHRGIPGNPGGSLEPAVTTRAWEAGSYESDASWQRRIRSDLERNSSLLEQRLGRRPRAIVWPYGRYNEQTEAIARELGMAIGLSLDAGQDARVSPISRIRRLLVEGNPPLPRFAGLVRRPDEAPTVRFIEVGLDSLAEAGGTPLAQRLDELMARIRELGVETVLLPAFAQPRAPGRIEAVYFPNRRLPVRADLLNQVAWVIATRTEARVFAWLPSDGFAFERSPDDPDARQAIGDLFEDLGRSTYLQGLAVGPSYAPDGATEGKPSEVTGVIAAAARAAVLAERTRAWQPQLRTAWLFNAEAAPLSAASIEAVLGQHDYLLAVLPTPANAGEADLLTAIRSVSGAPARTLLAVAPEAGLPADARGAKAGERAEALQRAGFPNLGVIGADLEAGSPGFAALRRALSLRSRPPGAAREGG